MSDKTHEYEARGHRPGGVCDMDLYCAECVREAERARIVKWMRALGRAYNGIGLDKRKDEREKCYAAADALERTATEIERGDHA